MYASPESSRLMFANQSETRSAHGDGGWECERAIGVRTSKGWSGHGEPKSTPRQL
jgi:hypothetical protein